MDKSFDLHTHTSYSDGELTPQALVTHAQEQGIDVLALTDHDTVAGLAIAAEQAARLGIDFIPGVELSVSWYNHTIHIVGLNIDATHPVLQEGLVKQKIMREQRTQQMVERLQKLGINDVAEVVVDAPQTDVITRSHFAAFLLKKGYVKDHQQAFTRYLGRGKAAYVESEWVSLRDAIAWIRAAGGDAVIAHPTRYRLTGSKLRQLVVDFTNEGGTALEVITARTQLDEIQWMNGLCREYGLLASIGSDFHGPSTWANLGKLRALPRDAQPIWSKWSSTVT